MVSRILYYAVVTLCSQNVYGRAECIDNHYWPWAVTSLTEIQVQRKYHQLDGFRGP